MQLTREHFFIEEALYSHWPSFCELVGAMASFVAEDYTPEQVAQRKQKQEIEFARLSQLNPLADRLEMEQLAQELVPLKAPEFRYQFADKFSNRFAAQFVQIALLSHALCEAYINFLLAMGLAQNSSQELFALIDRSELGEKWRIGPKILSPAYALQTECEPYATLRNLIKRRNSFVHHKTQIKVGDTITMDGSVGERLQFRTDARFAQRYFTVAYELMVSAQKQMPIASFARTVPFDPPGLPEYEGLTEKINHLPTFKVIQPFVGAVKIPNVASKYGR